jgi:flavin-binding protein dodecin
MAVARVSKITAASTKSFQEATEEGLERATKTLRGVTGFEVISMKGKVEKGKVIEYRVTLEVTFILEWCAKISSGRPLSGKNAGLSQEAGAAAELTGLGFHVLRNEPGRAAKRNRSDQATLGLRPTSVIGTNRTSSDVRGSVAKDTLRTARSIPGAQVTIMERLGHFPMSENPEPVSPLHRAGSLSNPKARDDRKQESVRGCRRHSLPKHHTTGNAQPKLRGSAALSACKFYPSQRYGEGWTSANQIGLRDFARRVTFISKVKTRVRLRCEAEAVSLLNVLVVPQRWQAHLPQSYAGRVAILRCVRDV